MTIDYRCPGCGVMILDDSAYCTPCGDRVNRGVHQASDVQMGPHTLHVEPAGHGAFVVTNWPEAWPAYGEPGAEGGWDSIEDLMTEAALHLLSELPTQVDLGNLLD